MVRAGTPLGRGGVFYAHTALTQAITFVLRPTAAYRALELDVPAYWLGALGASFALVPLVLALPSGTAADRFGEKRVMLVGAGFVLASTGLFIVLGGQVGGVILASVVLGVGHLCAVVGQQAMVANRTPWARYDRAFGHYTFAASLGQAIGPGLIVAFGGAATIPRTSAIFAWTVGLAVLLLVLSLALPRQGSATVTRREAADAGGVARLVRTPGLVRALLVSCVVLAAVDITLVYLPALGAEQGISAGVVGTLLVLRAVASMTSRLFLGSLSAFLGRRPLMVGSILLAAGSLALLPLDLSVWALGGLVVLAGLGLGAGQPLTMSWMAEATPPGLRGRAMSLRLTGNRLGQVLMPSVAGLLAVSGGAAAVIWLTAASLAGVGLAALRLTSSARPDDAGQP